MLSDHDHFTDPAELDPKGMVLIPGNEITAYGPHLLHVNAHRRIIPDPDRQGLIDAIAADGGVCVVNHPNWWENHDHCPHPEIESWRDYLGIEIYNGVCLRLEGSHLATDRWDRLLSQGRTVWGFANDDSHEEYDRGLAWNVVQAEKRNPGYVVRAMRQGRFYASTGVEIQRVAVEDGVHCRGIGKHPGLPCYHGARTLRGGSGRRLPALRTERRTDPPIPAYRVLRFRHPHGLVATLPRRVAKAGQSCFLAPEPLLAASGFSRLGVMFPSCRACGMVATHTLGLPSRCEQNTTCVPSAVPAHFGVLAFP